MKLKKNRRVFVSALLLWSVSSLQALAIQPGEQAPGLTLPLLGGGTDISLTDFSGKVVYVDFWASWCGPCRRSLPLYEALYQRHSADRFQILAVNLDEKLQDAQDFLKSHPVSYPILLDPDGKSASAWSVLAMPSSYLVDSDGKLAYIYLGFEKSHMEKIEDDIKRLLHDLPSPLPGTDPGNTDGVR